MATITDYASLVTAVQSFGRDRSDFATNVDYFIQQGEEVIWYGIEGMEPLRCREMETIATVTLTSGVGTLPTDYLQYRRVTSAATSPRRELEYITPTGSDQQYPSRASGPGYHFTIIGSSLYTFPLVATSCELTYYAKAAALTASATTNWLCTKHPGIYLQAALMIAEGWGGFDKEMQKRASMLKALIGAKNRSDLLANQAKAGITFRTRVA